MSHFKAKMHQIWFPASIHSFICLSVRLCLDMVDESQRCWHGGDHGGRFCHACLSVHLFQNPSKRLSDGYLSVHPSLRWSFDTTMVYMDGLHIYSLEFLLLVIVQLNYCACCLLSIFLYKCKKLNSLKQLLTATQPRIHHTTKTAKIKKLLFLWQHVAIMSSCQHAPK